MKRFLALIAVLALPLFATTVTPMSVERLTQASSHVIMGQAGESWSEWNQQHTQIFTYTRFHISKILKGGPASTVVVKQMGGRAGGYEQKVAGVRQLQTGERAVLFVHPSQIADGTMVVTGLMQGDFRVIGSEKSEVTVSNGVAGVNQYRRENGSLEHYSGAQMPLHELESRVRAASQKAQQ